MAKRTKPLCKGNELLEVLQVELPFWHGVIPCYFEVKNVSISKLHENAALMFNKRVTNNILKRF